VIRAEIPRRAGTSNRLLEHPAKCHTIDDASLNSKTDDPPRELIVKVDTS